MVQIKPIVSHQFCSSHVPFIGKISYFLPTASQAKSHGCVKCSWISCCLMKQLWDLNGSCRASIELKDQKGASPVLSLK